jgi:hypothetical protein
LQRAYHRRSARHSGACASATLHEAYAVIEALGIIERNPANEAAVKRLNGIDCGPEIAWEWPLAGESA